MNHSWWHVLLFASALASGAAAQEEVWIRANQIGYLPGDVKIAVLSSERPQSGSFRVGALRRAIGPDLGAWGPFQHNYHLDFSALRDPGRYTIEFGDTRSRPFSIGPDVYAAVREDLLAFLRLQRCGDNPVAGKCHQEDGIDVESGKRVDLMGGWHDAGDRLKHMITTTYCVAALYLADADDEARHGAALVKKLHPDAQTIYVQIGDDRDHLPPATLWHDDQSDYGWGPGGPRAAWRATGEPQGPKYKNASTGLANLAGRAAAAMALAGELESARSLYRLALARPGCAMSVPVRAPYYYGESTYHDDLEWAAIELFLASGEKRFLEEAYAHARAAGESQWMGARAHGHYEFFPYVNLAHWRLHTRAESATRAALEGYYRAGLERVWRLARANPYRLGTPLVWCSTNDAIAAATQAALYQRMSGSGRYRELAAAARDWIFGRNPWGVTFVVGVPAGGASPHHPHHLFDKLADILPVGGLVDGPVTKEINDGLKFGDFGEDRYARFQSEVGVYHDAYMDFSTNEPILDGTVSLLLLLHLWQRGPQWTRDQGAIVRGDPARRELALIFTGGEHGEGTAHILDALERRDLRAGFFLTGGYLTRPGQRDLVARMLAEGHYVGPHSHAHPLYCAWDDRGRSLIDEQSFRKDLGRNLAELRTLGACPADAPVYFIPPYEWFNAEQVAWSRAMGVTLFNFTPGSGSNRDWAPEGHPSFSPSREILDGILAHEQRDPHGLNGFLLLLHLGSQRRDKMHALIGPLLDELLRRGYRFARIDQLLSVR